MKTVRSPWRLPLTLLATFLATSALTGGGLAAWNATTQNNGDTVSTGSVHHNNVATVSGGSAVTCNDTNSPGTCGAIFTLSNLKPGQTATGGTVQITNTGSLASTFALSQPSAPVTS